MLDLPFANELLHCSRDILNRNVWVNTVLVEEVDDVRLESLERGISDLLNMLRSTVEPGLLVGFGIKLEAELSRYCYFATERRERFTHELFVSERTVDLGGVEFINGCNFVLGRSMNPRRSSSP